MRLRSVSGTNVWLARTLWRKEGSLQMCNAIVEVEQRTDIPALCEKYTQPKKQEQERCASPSVWRVRC